MTFKMKCESLITNPLNGALTLENMREKVREREEKKKEGSPIQKLIFHFLLIILSFLHLYLWRLWEFLLKFSQIRCNDLPTPLKCSVSSHFNLPNYRLRLRFQHVLGLIFVISPTFIGLIENFPQFLGF